MDKNNHLTKHFPAVSIIIKGKIEKLLEEKPALEVEDYVKSELKKSIGIQGCQ